MLRRYAIALFALTILVKFLLLGSMPFSFDETLYAEMVAEEAENPSFLPTYLGYPAPWKPGLSFFAYSLFLPISAALFNSLEYIYRFPVFLFGLLNAVLLYLLVKRFFSEDTALAASLIFYSSIAAFNVEGRLLMEPFMLSMALISLLCYSRKNRPITERSLLGGLFALAAALTKSVVALLIPVLAIAYMLQYDRRNISSPAFLLSLLAVPLGLALFWFSLSGIGLSEAIFFTDTGKMFIYDYSSGILFNILFGSMTVILLMLPIYAASTFSFFSKWKENLLFSAWMLLLFALLFLGQRPWYYYYAMPPVALFAALLLLPKNRRMDTLALLLLSAITIFSCSMAMLKDVNPSHAAFFDESRQVGLMLSGEENALFVGLYPTNTISVSYKILEERRVSGDYLDFGYIIFDGIRHNATEASMRDFIEDYRREDYGIEDRNFAAIFWHDKIFRKSTSITRFDYVVVSPPFENQTLDGYHLEFEGNLSSVYRRVG